MVFDDVTDTDADLLARFTAGLGTGVGGLREICGAVSAMAIVDSLTGYKTPVDKPALYYMVSNDGEEFRRINGSLVCRELKQPGGKPCTDLIADAVTILYKRLLAHAE
ncbi:MAG: C-GCAxxG-C-C family protein [Duncaniella sp.]|nr:C-GCAxxG-C-C family protein [Duncaniella sp.]